MRRTFHLLLLLLCTLSLSNASVAGPADVSSAVVVLTDANFESFLKESPIAFILFYAPWCYWSKQTLPEFAAAAQMLSHHDPPVRLAQIDSAAYHDIGRSQSVQEYPTLRLYLDAGATDESPPFIPFTGGRTKAQIIHWIEEHLNKDKTLVSTAHVDDLLQPHHKQLVVLGMYPSGGAPVAVGATFMKIAREFGANIIFAHTNDTSIRTHMENKYVVPELTTAEVPSAASTYIALFTPHTKEVSVHLHTDKLDRRGIRSFVRQHEFPAVTPFTMEKASKLFGDGRPICVLVVDTSQHAPADLIGDKKDDMDAASHHALHTEMHERVLAGSLTREKSSIEDVYRSVGQQLRNSFVFTTSGTTEPHEKRLLSLIGVTDEDVLPAVRIVTFNPKGHGLFQPALKYRPQENNKFLDMPSSELPAEVEDYFKLFLSSYRKNALKPFLKSEAVPEEDDNQGPVRVIVGHSFDSEVRESQKEVFVEFYAPWCGHCRKMEPALKELATRLKPVDGVVIAKVDATRNEVKDISFSGYPTVMFFAAGKKNAPMMYHGNRSVEDMMRWIKERASAQFNVEALLSVDLASASRSGGSAVEDLLEEL
eukprot:GHVS01084285.1.p1 GENE.GHVS01084285.1~~GHVS01084285.1.p1  ORF type:complete len:594 (-),score=117.91 GHVS01084285.1:335-2116(-)